MKSETVNCSVCLTLCDTMDWKPARLLCPWDSSARILEWVAIPFSNESSQPRDHTQAPSTQVDSLPSEPPGKPIWL